MPLWDRLDVPFQPGGLPAGRNFLSHTNMTWYCFERFRNPVSSPVEVASLSHYFSKVYVSLVVFSPDFWTINSMTKNLAPSWSFVNAVGEINPYKWPEHTSVTRVTTPYKWSYNPTYNWWRGPAHFVGTPKISPSWNPTGKNQWQYSRDV